MVKIISEPDANWTVQVTCPECGRVLEAEENDVFVQNMQSSPYPSSMGNGFFIRCPAIDCRHTIQLVNVPKTVQQAALYREQQERNRINSSYR